MELDRLPYSRFAYVYDDMMSNVNYRRWANYVADLFRHYKYEPRRVLDLACGTGSTAVYLAQMGFEMTGIDRAQEMLDRGREKANRAGVAIHWQAGDMRSFTVEKPFDAVLCLYDSINYALNLKELRQVFDCTREALAQDGLFIFDVTTERNIVEHFHLETYADNHADYSYIWKNVYTKSDKICRTELTFFLRQPDGHFERHVETHLQKIFEVGEIRNQLLAAGFEPVSAFDAWTFSKHHRSSDRINFTAQKR